MKTWNNQPIVELGSCSQPHGIKGAFSFRLINTKDSSLDLDSKIILFPSSPKSNIPVAGQQFEIEKISFGHKVMAYLKGITDRSVVEAMLPFTIHILKSDLPELDEDEVYLDDLIGCKAIHIETGKELGRIIGLEDNGVQAILVIRGSEAMDIPFVDAFVGEIDLEAQTVQINPPEYV
ncbi:MAG: ribosome maturation factor RimM [bacterium]